MSRNTLMIAGLALILAIGALVLQFVLPSGGGVSEAELDSIRADVAVLKQTSASESMRIAYMDAEEAFSVFLVATQDLRQRIGDKTAEIQNLQAAINAGTISTEEANRRYAELRAELLEVQVNTVMGTLDRMIASEGFSDIRSVLVNLSESAQPLIQNVRELVSAVKVGSVDSATFSTMLATLNAQFQELDGYVTDSASTALTNAANDVAREYGYDVVLLKKDVIVYSNPVTMTDITDLIKAEIEDFL